MAGMSLFGRRWAIATDDFLLIGIVDVIFFLAWFSWSSVILVQRLQANCACTAAPWCYLLSGFFAGSCLLFALNTMLAGSFIIFSTRGTISEPGSRRHVPKLVQMKLVLSLLDLVWAILGSIASASDSLCDKFDVTYNVKVLCACFWFMFVVRVCLVWVMYDPRGKLKKSNKLRKTIPNEHLSPPAPFGSSKKWRHRMQVFCLGLTAPSEDRRIAIGTASELLAFLSHDLDLVASDLMAGLILYRQKCLKEHRDDSEDLKSLPRILLQDGTAADRLPTADMPTWMNLKLACRYFTLGMGIFGWPWVLYRNFISGSCQVLGKCMFCFTCRSESDNVEGDNCCGCNLAGLRTSSGFAYEDLVHVCFLNRVYEIPFFVSLDHSTSSVVLTVRGSMSCADALTDLSAAFESIDDCDLPKDTLCHGGFLIAARRIRAKLEEKRVLERAFSGREHYHLVLTGHSLGASVATLLALMYRNVYDVRCFAFAPPPVVNEAALPYTTDRVFTVIYGNDVVPYLNYWNVRNMIVDAVNLLNECKLPKYKVLFGAQNERDSEHGNSITSSMDSESRGDSQSPVLDAEKAETTENHTRKTGANGNCISQPEGRTRFFVPGRILRIRHSKKYGYRLQMCNTADFKPLLCKRHMVLHHFPQYMEMSLKCLGQEEVLRADGMDESPDSKPQATKPNHQPSLENNHSVPE